MSTRVKICGVTTHTDIEIIEAAGADSMGVISNVSVDTPRAVTETTAKELFDAASPYLSTVLVTMPASVESAVELGLSLQPDVVQIHTEFSGAQYRQLASAIPSAIVGVVGASSCSRAYRIASSVDGLLIDSVGGDGGGGTGETHDWSETAAIVEAISTPVILAGGLTPDNVGPAIDAVNPYGVDVASGVETHSPNKDQDAVTKFVTNARNVSHANTLTETEQI